MREGKIIHKHTKMHPLLITWTDVAERLNQTEIILQEMERRLSDLENNTITLKAALALAIEHKDHGTPQKND